MDASTIKPEELESFKSCLRQSDRVLALCGAGLSASSGLPTFRGSGGLWRSHDATRVATPTAFGADPAFVWQFYSWRRHLSLQAEPNAAHYALAALALRKPNFLTLTQNVDGLSRRANHPEAQIKYLHGSLFDIKCTDFFCNYKEENNTVDPIVPALAIPREQRPKGSLGIGSSSEQADGSGKLLDISDDRVELPKVPLTDLPRCPRCQNLLRPGVVWFGEMLPKDTINEVDQFIDESAKIDLILVIGTSAKVYPAAGYVDEARAKGARVAVVNLDGDDIPGRSGSLDQGDWFFKGDASVLLPVLLSDGHAEAG